MKECFAPARPQRRYLKATRTRKFSATRATLLAKNKILKF